MVWRAVTLNLNTTLIWYLKSRDKAIQRTIERTAILTRLQRISNHHTKQWVDRPLRSHKMGAIILAMSLQQSHRKGQFLSWSTTSLTLKLKMWITWLAKPASRGSKSSTSRNKSPEVKTMDQKDTWWALSLAAKSCMVKLNQRINQKTRPITVMVIKFTLNKMKRSRSKVNKANISMRLNRMSNWVISYYRKEGTKYWTMKMIKGTEIAVLT